MRTIDLSPQPGVRKKFRIVHGSHCQQVPMRDKDGNIRRDSEGSVVTKDVFYRARIHKGAFKDGEDFTGDIIETDEDLAQLNPDNVSDAQKFVPLTELAPGFTSSNPFEKMPGESAEQFSARMNALAEQARALAAGKPVPPLTGLANEASPQKTATVPATNSAVAGVSSNVSKAPTATMPAKNPEVVHTQNPLAPSFNPDTLKTMTLKQIQEWAEANECDGCLKGVKTKEEAVKALVSFLS